MHNFRFAGKTNLSICLSLFKVTTISRNNTGPGDINLFKGLYWLHLPFIFFTCYCPYLGIAVQCVKGTCEALCLKLGLRIVTVEH